jgi:hypothetical protein
MGTTHFSELMKSFYDYWLSLPRESGQIIPSRKSINPAKMKSILPYFFLSEWKNDNEIINKITGTNLDEVLGANFTGINFLKNYDGERLKFYQQYWSALRTTPCGAQLDRQVNFPNGKIYQMSSLHLPLLGPQGDVIFYCGTNESKQAFFPDDINKPFELLNKTKISRMSFFDIGAGLPDNPPDIEIHNNAE